MTIVIVGGGLAGGHAAAALREGGHDGPIVLYTAEEHLPYERPPLSKGVLLGNDEPDSVFLHDAAWYVEHDIEIRSGVEVTAIDPSNHQVRTADGEQEYSKLVLATGSLPRRLPVADESEAAVAYLRTIEDSARLRTAFAGKPSVLVIGGGWIGLEVAAAARQVGCEVTVLVRDSLPLVKLLGPEVARVFADLHTAHGVHLRLDLEATPTDLAAADLVVVGIGALPNTELAERAGLAVDDGIVVDAHLRTSHPDVYAVGDVARHDHPQYGPIRIEHWDNAIEQGKAAARHLLGDESPYDRQPYFFTDQYDLGSEYVGHVGAAGYARVAIEGDLDGAFQTFWLDPDDVVLAALQVNDWDASDRIKAAVGQRYPLSD